MTVCLSKKRAFTVNTVNAQRKVVGVIEKEKRLIIPSCSGLLDCFNNRLTRYHSAESMYCLQGEVNTPLVIQLFSYIYTQHFTPSAPATWCFKTSGFKQYIGYTEGSKSKDLFGQLSELSSLTYLYKHIGQGRAVEVTFNEKKTYMTVQSKYFEEIYAAMKIVLGNKNGAKLSIGRSAYSSMVYASIFKERNIGACEIAIELCRLIERRGHLEKGEFAHISMATLSERCPTLHTRLKNTVPKEGNRVFRTALTKGLELLEKYTSIYECFVGLKIIIPEKIQVTKECEIKIFYNKRIIMEGS